MEKADLLIHIQKLQMSNEDLKAKAMKDDYKKLKEELVHSSIALQHANSQIEKQAQILNENEEII